MLFLCSQWVGLHPPEQSTYSASPVYAEALYSRKLTWVKCNFHWTDRATGWVSHRADQYCTQRGNSSQSWKRAGWRQCVHIVVSNMAAENNAGNRRHTPALSSGLTVFTVQENLVRGIVSWSTIFLSFWLRAGDDRYHSHVWHEARKLTWLA